MSNITIVVLYFIYLFFIVYFLFIYLFLVGVALSTSLHIL